MKKYLCQLIDCLNQEIKSLKTQLSVYKDSKIAIIASEYVPQNTMLFMSGFKLSLGQLLVIEGNYYEVANLNRNDATITLKYRDDL